MYASTFSVRGWVASAFRRRRTAVAALACGFALVWTASQLTGCDVRVAEAAVAKPAMPPTIHLYDTNRIVARAIGGDDKPGCTRAKRR